MADALAAAVVRAYLDRPTQTRAAIAGIVRLDLTATVIAERDRFALELCARIAPLLPGWPEASLHSAVRDICDAAMGVLSAELYRAQPRPPEHVTRVVADLTLRLLSGLPPASPATERGHERFPARRGPDGGRHGA